MELAPRATVGVDLRAALAAAGRSDLTSGAVGLRYSSPYVSNLAAVLNLLNQEDSLTFQFPLLEGYLGSASRTLESYWWFPDEETQGTLVLFNQSASGIVVTPTFSLPAGLDFPGEPVELGARGQARLDLRARLRDFGLQEEPIGGIRLQYTGEQLSLLAVALFANDDTGYSNQSRFVGHDVLHQETGASFLEPRVHTLRAFATLGRPAPGSGFPASLSFRPKLLLRNTTEQTLALDLQFTYMGEGQPIVTSLPVAPLFSEETRLVDLAEFVEGGLLPGAVSEGAVAVTYTGFPNDLGMALASVDQSGNWVLPAHIFPNGSSVFQGVHWRTDGNWNTVVRVQNIGPEAAKVELRLHYNLGSGEYRLPAVEVAPGALYAFDLKEVIARNQPDTEGNTLPAGVSSGGLRLAVVPRAEGEGIRPTLLAEAVVFDPVRGTCGGNLPCCGFIDIFFDAPSLVGTVGDVSQLRTLGRLCDGTQQIVNDDTIFSSSAPSVISVENGGFNHGRATCNAVGTCTLRGEAELPSGQSLFDPCVLLLFATTMPGEVRDLASFRITVTSTPVSGETNSVVSGQSAQVRVEAMDNTGAVFTRYRGTVSFSSSDTLATLPGNYTYTATDAGSHTFNVTLKTVAGTSPTRDFTAHDVSKNISSANNILVWFQTTMDIERWKNCNFVNCPNPGSYFCQTACQPNGFSSQTEFLAITQSGLCNKGIALKAQQSDGSWSATTSTTVQDCGPAAGGGCSNPYWNWSAPRFWSNHNVTPGGLSPLTPSWVGRGTAVAGGSDRSAAAWAAANSSGVR